MGDTEKNRGNNSSIIDLHCDLLDYLALDRTHTPLDAKSRASLLQLQAGGVSMQTLAIFTETKKGSAAHGKKQLNLFLSLFERYNRRCALFPMQEEGKVTLTYAIENASSLIEEEASLNSLFTTLDAWIAQAGPPLYLSLTWNTENRFGGGNASKSGIKEDGKALLRYLSEKKICIDLSHTSDALAYDILNLIAKEALDLIPIASHSNYRAAANQKRNLPDELAQEIGKCNGIIGLNFVRRFIGKSFEHLIEHITHAKNLGLGNAIVFGADFFSDLPNSSFIASLKNMAPFFYKGFDTAACYPNVLSLLARSFSQEEIEKIAHKNALAFFERIHRSI